MFSVILYEPEIPPNTGNIIRLCANAGAQLHLVEPLGFDLEEKKLRRAGLDYREFVDVQTHASLDARLASLGHPRVFALSTRNALRYDKTTEFGKKAATISVIKGVSGIKRRSNGGVFIVCSAYFLS